MKLKNLRLVNVSGLQFGHSDNNIQTFTVGCYANIVDFKGTIPRTVGGLVPGMNI